jgi:hypothetical protein
MDRLVPHRLVPTRTIHSRHMRCVALFTWIAAVALAPTVPLYAEVVTYRLIVDNTWSQETHPGRMPPARAHFS